MVACALVGCGRVRTPPRPPAGQQALFTASSAGTDRLRAAVEGANVVYCIIDTARADHSHCYGYPRDTTPNIDGLAAQGLVFEDHFCQFPETKSSTATLFTGQYHDTHLAWWTRTLPENTFTLAQAFKAGGYETALFSQNEYASPVWGLGTHFDERYYKPQLKEAGYDKPLIWKPEALLEQVKTWLDKKPRRPFFAYVHFFPPHGPYISPKEFYSKFFGAAPPNAWQAPYPFDEVEVERRKEERPWDQATMINLYDGNYAYADWAVGELERLFKEAGLLDTTLLIVSADHGEAWGEHGYQGHTKSAWDETIHIPLVMKFPGKNGPKGRLTGLTQTVDMLPTLCDLFLLPYPKDRVQGKSLLPLMAGQAAEVNEYVFARTMGTPPSYAVRNHDRLLILYQGGKLRALYDLKKDPRALKNVIESEPEKAEEMYAAFRSFAKTQVCPPLDYLDPDAPTPEPPPVPAVEPDEDMRETIRAMGYLQ
jgi:arylsulfatase